MKKILIISILFSLFGTITAQTISGQIVHSDTKEPLAYVNIGVIGTTHGTVSDLSGKFELALPSTLSNTDSIRFSSISFIAATMTTETAAKQSPMVVQMQPSNINLPEVVVRAPFKHYEKRGNIKINPKNVTNLAINKLANQNLGSEIGRHFKGQKSAYLEQFRFYVAQNNFDTVHFRINIYTVKKGKPDRNLMPENLIITATNRQTGWIAVDLSRYQIKVEDDFVASAEWVYAGGKGNRLGFPISIPSVGATHFYKYGSQNDWKRFSQMSAAMEVTLGW